MDYYRDITFAAPTASLTNFPALVRIQNDRMKDRISSAYGYDVSFQQNGTSLPFDLDFYDSSTGNGAWWVQVPSLPSNASSTIRMVYGDPSITTNQSAPATVWADYTYVYHFNDLNNMDSVIGNYTPSDISTSGTTASLSIVSNAMTGRGMRFWFTQGYGNAYYALKIGNAINVSSGTISILASTDVFGWSDRKVELNTGWKQYRFYMNGTTFTTEAGSAAMSMARADANGFYCYGGSTNASEIGWSVNGVIQDASSGTPGSIRWDAPAIQGTGYVGNPTEMIFDEIRISTTTYKPAAWLQYEQNQMIHHASCTNYGYEYHSDGTPVIDFFPWIRNQVNLD